MYCDVLTFCDVNVLELLCLKLLRLETITFSDASLSDINVVLCYILSQYLFSGSLKDNQASVFLVALKINKCNAFSSGLKNNQSSVFFWYP
jgi:hypothetical protein